ncbi:MAG TPA: ATP-binding protein, partial [Candidatus Eisenbacteria bacterium]|nr:ATP-binding protein [Candidatus Eisenbacteria bacterium]
GFGLSTCYRIISNHGGKITAENGPRGAVFTLTIPLERKRLAA